jgi:hypothetical protein
MNDRDVIEIEWYEDEDAAEGALRDLANDLRAADPEAEVDVVEPHGILPVLGWIIAAIALAALVKQIDDIVCRRRAGLIIDARVTPMKIKKSKDLPGGNVIVIGKDGKSELHDVCDHKTDLGSLIKEAGGVTT